MIKTKHILLIGMAIILLGITAWIAFSQERNESVDNEIETEEIILPDTLRMVFAGDVMVHSTQYNSAWTEGGDSCYNFSPPFSHIRDYIAAADISVANLEVPLGGEPYSGYPLFSSPSEIADVMKETGFDVFLLANNHIVDRGKSGLEKTLDYLDKLGVAHTGAFRDSIEKTDRYPLLIEKNNIRLSLLNYTYGTNGIPVRAPNRVNRIDSLLIREDIRKAKEQNPDYIIACMHWGTEEQRKEHVEQQKIAQFMAEEGVDLIVGGHPHVVQPFKKIINSKGDTIPVIYSLGNFISNQQWRYNDGGITLEVTLVKNNDRIESVSLGYEPFWVHKFNVKGRPIYRMIPVNDYYRNPTAYTISDDKRRLMEQFYSDTRQALPNLPYGGFFGHPQENQ